MKIIHSGNNIERYFFNNAKDIQTYILKKYKTLKDHNFKIIYRRYTGVYLYIPGEDYTIKEYLVRGASLVLSLNQMNTIFKIMEDFIMESGL